VENSWAVCLVHAIDGVFVAGCAQVPHDHSIDILFNFVFLLVRIDTCLENPVKVAVKTVVIELDGQFFNDVLHNEEFSVFNSLLKRSLNVPEH